MARRGSAFDYAQLVIGDCGHVCNAWPEFTDLRGHNPKIVCDDCTREKYGLDNTEQLFVFVRPEEPVRPKPPPKPRKKKEPKPLTGMALLLFEEGLIS